MREGEVVNNFMHMMQDVGRRKYKLDKCENKMVKQMPLSVGLLMLLCHVYQNISNNQFSADSLIPNSVYMTSFVSTKLSKPLSNKCFMSLPQDEKQFVILMLKRVTFEKCNPSYRRLIAYTILKCLRYICFRCYLNWDHFSFFLPLSFFF